MKRKRTAIRHAAANVTAAAAIAAVAAAAADTTAAAAAAATVAFTAATFAAAAIAAAAIAAAAIAAVTADVAFDTTESDSIHLTPCDATQADVAATDAAHAHFRHTSLAVEQDEILQWLGHDDWAVRVVGLRMIYELEQAALASYSTVVVSMLTDPASAYQVRYWVSMTMHKMGPAALAPHVGAFVRMLKHPHPTIRYLGVGALDELEWAVLAPHEISITDTLTDEDWNVRSAAKKTLGNMKRKLTRLHWATARAFVHRVRPYALFWHECVGESLCAPGGKWAQRDRAAFEDEFSERRP